MNGPVYISFFQGQLESVLEQVVQHAVQEISKTVGSSLNTLLLETAVKEQENRRLRLQLQSRENSSDGGGSPVPGKNKNGEAAGDERADGGRTKTEQHAPGGQGTQPGLPTDTRRLEQRGRLVGRHPLYNTRSYSHTRKQTVVRSSPPSVSASNSTITLYCITAVLRVCEYT